MSFISTQNQHGFYNHKNMAVVSISPYNSSISNYALGNIRRTGVGNWNAIRTGTPVSGNVSQTGNTTNSIGVGWTGGARGSFSLSRNYAWYDVTSYQTVTITNAELACPTMAAATMLANPVIAVDSSTAFSNNTISTLVLSEFLSTSFVGYSNSTAWIQTTGTQTITLNGSAISAIQSGNKFGVGIIDYDYDYQNVAPSGIGFSAFYVGDMSSASRRADWKLTLTYTAGWSGGDMNGVANSNMGEVNGVALADISEINGI